MLFSRLKMQIAGTLVILLALAIMLGNIVVLAFWQQKGIRNELDHARSLSSSFQSFDNLRDRCVSAGKPCVGVVLSTGEHWLKKNLPSLQTKSVNMAREAAATRGEMLRMEDDPWGIFSFKSRYLLFAQPWSLNNSQPEKAAGVIFAVDSIYASLFSNYQTIFVYWLVNVLVLTVVGFFRLNALTVRPIEHMARLSESCLDADLINFSGDESRSEIGQLSMTLHGMLSRIESDREKLRNTVSSLEEANSALVKTQKEMIRTEKIASVGRLSAGLAHEIGNPIGIIQGYVELLQQADLDADDRQQFSQRALGELERINRLIRQLLDYAGSSSREISIINIPDVFTGVCQIINLKKTSRPITVSCEIKDDIYVEGDRESLRQVFLNCLLNSFDAIDSCPDDRVGAIVIEADKALEGGATHPEAHIRINDNGSGISKNDLAVIFDPFFTTKDPGKGTGLGLFVSHSIIDAHGGRIWIESPLGQGAIVHIMLPLYTAAIQGRQNEITDH